jgi:phthiocerol/phenolphthiocerol synthesis type-I polyketide synthase E
MRNDTDAVAIVGLAARFPGARNVAELWRNLCAGKHSIRYFSEEELLASGIKAADLSNPNYVRAAAMIDDVDLFDCQYFGYSPRDAALIDPQQRLFLECAVHAFEAARIDPAGFAGKIGVFAGSAISPYLLHGGKAATENAFTPENMAFGTANDKDYVATRVSYCLDLQGPSVTVQSACSTSLLAIHMAWRSIMNGECDVALAGGVSVAQGRQLSGYRYAPGGVLSKDGLCRPFDAAATGTIFGDGVGIVVLQRLSSAKSDGRAIKAIIRSSATSNDGSGKLAFAAPSVEGQTRTIRAALEQADLRPSDIDYVEAHGTGTQLGDRIEVEALRSVFAGDPDVEHCLVGSIKANIGHLNTAAGVAGLIKAVLVLENNLVPAMANFEAPSPAFKLGSGPIAVNATPYQLEPKGRPARAGVSAFGIGGTNVHMILEAHAIPVAERPEPVSDRHLLLMSAQTAGSLDRFREELLATASESTSLQQADLASTLACNRTHYPIRQFLLSNGKAAPFTSRVCDRGRGNKNRAHVPPKIVFLFPGQGVEVAAPSEATLRAHPVLNNVYNDVLGTARRIARERGVDPLGCHDRPINPSTGWPSILDPVVIAAFYYALGRLLQRWGSTPAAFVGHSLGEYIAAALSEVLSVEEMITLVMERALLMETLPKGGMIGVPLSAGDARSQYGDTLDVAVLTAPGFSVLSGPAVDIDTARHALAANGVDAVALNTPFAFHSRMMDAILKPFAERCKNVPSRRPTTPFTSGVDGAWYVPHEPETYWPRHMREPMQLDACIRRVKEEIRPALFVQLGPGASFHRTIRDAWNGQASPPVYSPFAANGALESASLLQLAGELWLNGVNLDWRLIVPGSGTAEIPPYPFERMSFWLADNAPAIGATSPNLSSEPRVFEPTWLRQGPVQPARPIQDTLLVFCREEQLRFQQRGAVCVTPASKFARYEDGNYAINYADPTDYDRLFGELHRSGRWPRFVHHLLLLQDCDEAGGPEGRVMRGYKTLMNIGRALSAHSELRSDPIQLTAFTNVAFRIDDRDKPCWEDAIAASAFLGLQQEVGHLTCQLVDLPEGSGCDKLPWTDPGDGLIVAVRGGYRWSREVHPISISETAPLVSSGKVYLISGGLGGIGQMLARHLIEHYGATVLITGRATLEMLGVAKRPALASLGKQAHYLALDPADFAGWRKLFENPAGCSHIDGIFHLSGDATGALIDGWSQAGSDRVLAPKISGTRALLAAARDHRPDFVVLFSSLAATLGGFGMTDYAAANAYLDAVAESYDGAHCKVFSIAWDIWADTGMARSAGATAGQSDPQFPADAIGLDPEKALEILFTLVDGRAPRSTIVSKRDVPKERTYWHAAKLGAALSASLAQAGSGILVARPANCGPYVAPDTDVQKIAARLWSETLGVSPIGVEDDFFDLGGHSLAIIGLITALRKHFGVTVLTRDFYEHRTLAGLSLVIETRMLDDIEAESLDEVSHDDSSLSPAAAEGR